MSWAIQPQLRQAAAVVILVLPLSGAGLAAAASPASDAAAFNVSIAVFDPGVPDDASLHRDLQVFPRIREVESRFLPFVLREALAATGNWGAVRVVPELDGAAELQVTGVIVQSDGEVLELQVRANDASGRVWFDSLFTGAVTNGYAGSNDDGVGPGNQRLYDEISAALLAARGQLSAKEHADIAEISRLRYAAELAPSAFGEYLEESGEGRYILRRLPARDDPMLARIERLRSTEYVITDAVDTKYQELNAEIAAVYDLWRAFRRKGVEYQAQNAARAQKNESEAASGSYEAIENLYNNYKWERVTAQEQDRLAVAFDNEVGPKVQALEVRVAELEGWVDEKYAEWHRLLEALFEVETRMEQ